MFNGFKAFIMRGNVLDLAIGVIIGAAFGKIVSSFVNDILMPPLGLLIGGIDFANQFLVLKGGTYPTLAAAKADTRAVVISYGVFLNNIIDFLIVAFAVYVTVVQLQKLIVKPVAAPVTTKDCPYCATAIPLAAKRCPHCTSQLA